MKMKMLLAIVMIASLLVLAGCFGKKAAPASVPASVAPAVPSAPAAQSAPAVQKTVAVGEEGVINVKTTASNPTVVQDQPFDSPKRNEAQTTGCTDSDSGVNYFVQGSLKDVKGSTKMDQCSRNEVFKNQLYEYYCGEDGGYVRVVYECPNGCSEGACVQ